METLIETLIYIRFCLFGLLIYDEKTRKNETRERERRKKEKKREESGKENRSGGRVLDG